MLRFPNKELRAEVICRYVREAGYKGVVCFSCGNASAALRNVGLQVVDISAKGALQANRWWYPEEIYRVWPDYFDATSGHLCLSLMNRIGQEFKGYLGGMLVDVDVPCGSGETLVCLKLAFPTVEFNAIYDNNKPETEYCKYAPLNDLVARLAKQVTIIPVHK